MADSTARAGKQDELEHLVLESKEALKYDGIEASLKGPP